MKILSTTQTPAGEFPREVELTEVEAATSQHFESLLDLGHGITVAAYLAITARLTLGFTLEAEYVAYLSESTLLLNPLSGNVLATSPEAFCWLAEGGITPGQRPFVVRGTTMAGDEITAVGLNIGEAMSAYDEAEAQAAMVREQLAEESKPLFAVEIDLNERRPGIEVPQMERGRLVHPEYDSSLDPISPTFDARHFDLGIVGPNPFTR